ncbi:exopolysaccharide biosynthesis polyprenyl glycosylphosphotransferase [Bacillus tianshenii]|uniref:Exopolysaccharide biosynthesis polyprenyl glycosylphosphotransferase n=1 Tax=Sutcliffiella tianshenii TaxID=1463404 RepID=A0ABS2NUQ6_9BACI|nr:sugar transferase [Bacillus tianshenii]MBM7618381.1 exopolysaccharide biosynthesis polyprenyl glycosylphosphotransferase [Bacillus tianshenii]
MKNILDEKGTRVAFIVVDVALITISYFLAFYIRSETYDARNWDSFFSVLPWIMLISVFFLSVFEVNPSRRKRLFDYFGSIIVSTTSITIATMAVSFFFRAFGLPRSVILLSFIIGIALLTIWKVIFLYIRKTSNPENVLIISNPQDKRRLMYQVEETFASKINLHFIDYNSPIEEIYEAIKNAESVVIGSKDTDEKKSSIIYYSFKNNKNLYLVPSFYDLLLSKSDITPFEDTMALSIKPFGLSIDQQIIKRTFDLVVSIVVLPFLIPIGIFGALLIKLESPKGSIFFKQARLGKDNKEFSILKFRTMVENAESATGPTLAKEKDPRITKIGSFLRATRIDEIPQILNVLKGDMSIVGPRPERSFFIEQFKKDISSYEYRNSVKPGITGYAQIMGKYTTGVQDKLRFDLHYIRNYSLMFDIIILLRTVLVLVDKTKSEGVKTQPQENN